MYNSSHYYQKKNPSQTNSFSDSYAQQTSINTNSNILRPNVISLNDGTHTVPSFSINSNNVNTTEKTQLNLLHGYIRIVLNVQETTTKRLQAISQLKSFYKNAISISDNQIRSSLSVQNPLINTTNIENENNKTGINSYASVISKTFDRLIYYY